MEEIIEKASPEAAEKVIEKVTEGLSYSNAKYLGAFGAGAVVGVFAYRKVLLPAWNWVQSKRKPKDIVIDMKKAKAKDQSVEDAEPIEDDSQE